MAAGPTISFRKKRGLIIILAVCISLVAGGLVLWRNHELPWQKKVHSAPKRVCLDVLSGAEVVRLVSGSAGGKHGEVRAFDTVESVSEKSNGLAICQVKVPVTPGTVRAQSTLISHPDGDARATFDFAMSLGNANVEGAIRRDFPSGATPFGGGLSGAVTDSEAWLRMPECAKAPQRFRGTPQFAKVGIIRSDNAPLENVRPILTSMLTRLTNRSLELIGCDERIQEPNISAGPVRRTPLGDDRTCLPIAAADLGIPNTAGWTRESFRTDPDIVSWCDVFNEKGERALRFTKMHSLLRGPESPVNSELSGGKALQWGCEPRSYPDYDAPVRVLERLDDRLRPVGELKAAIVAAAPEPAACAVAAK
ncbi:hypothetical protein [Embleya sp. NPDC059259]|uniref:hypothetical protein n=1 Tax=unclassified Embleya TaxID=2699296 RepID=UPI0036CDC049